MDTDPKQVLHYPSSLCIPLAITPSMPTKAYTRSTGEIKTAIHWGQRKLLLSEVELLTLYCTPGRPYWFVYAGAAPCSHMLCLERMYAKTPHTYELVDPSPFDARLRPGPNLILRNEFFTNRVAYGIAGQRMARCPALRFIFEDQTLGVLGAQPAGDCVVEGDRKEAHNTGGIPSIYEAPLTLPHGISTLCYALADDVPTVFISDIRSGSLQSGDFEKHVIDNMKAQAVWHRIIRPEYSLLKFRLPYMVYDEPSTGEVRRHNETHTPYMAGKVLLPIWTRPTSTECRLLCKAYAPDVMYDNKSFEDSCHYFNAVLRQRVHFNHAVDLMDPDLDHKYDATAEIQILAAHAAYELTAFNAYPTPLPMGEDRMMWLLQRMASLKATGRIYSDAVANARVISVELQRTFARAIQARDEIMLSKARQAGWEPSLRKLMAAANEERDRAVWWKNVPETEAMLREAQPWGYCKIRL